MERIQSVLDERMDPFFTRLTTPVAIGQSRSTAQGGLSLFNGPFCDTRTSQGELNNGLMKFEDTTMLPPWLLSYNCSCDIANNFEAFATVVSRLHQHLLDANVEISYTEYLDLMKVEVDQRLNKLNEDIRVFKSYNLAHGNDANGSCSLVCCDGKLIETDEGFNSLKLLLTVVFRQIREMLGLVNASIHDLQWEHELQLEVTSVNIGDCIRGLQDELERKLYEQSSIVNSLRKNWQETVAQCASIREELIVISNMLLPSEEESHISHSNYETLGNRSDRWKFRFFGKRTCEDHSPSSGEENGNSATQKSVSPSEVVSEKSDFRHLKGMTRQEMLNYFRSEISKLKRLHELDLQEKTEELFKFKRDKWSLALKYDVEFEPLRKKFPEVISRFDQIMSNGMAAPTICSTSGGLDEKSRLNSTIDSLYYENKHLRGLLAKKTKDVQELSCQLSDASRKISLQCSLEKQLLRQVSSIKGEYEDLYVESTIRDEIYQTVTRKLVDNHRNIVEDTVRNFRAKVSSFEATLSGKDKAFCLANEENQKLKEKLSILEKEHFIQNNQQDPELIKQESEEMILRDIEMEPHVSPRRSYDISDQDMHYEELIKLNQTLEISSTTLKEVETKKLDYSDTLGKREQEKQLDCILVSIMDLSKEFAEIEHKMLEDIKGNEKKTENLNDRCNHMVQQAIVLTKKGLWYKQMLDTRRSELQKAESEVDILGNKVNELLSLVQKIYVTLEHYSLVFQHHPVLLDAFLKTCKLVAGIRSRQKEDLQDTT
ncbi:WPP domain-associated protein-like [Phragmites australis]|uniref:WPP domain-associated protein-like n=1 Tax=Phragmites australis TaxID=29695 RepID=UPI002D77D6DB|nr:WPP domain-associated protein-like [Phragmites australis]XP_062188197.1 WPP domain-associated protein-like [Phragmites australis]XP_062188198.1 WPP domain-associated protein-like [Phragmites australis]XP_062188199.1 WPP domain-associated protein-like [Phragmites australis]XP_062188200.1 WPP domain-associated protein-like [Phragmites australis]XP_062188201.1 WPP domain-associated protein-like [Phragmites australis]XP_062188202.1 WPP domain-associated protein-like [Phragmites australis]XP_0